MAAVAMVTVALLASGDAGAQAVPDIQIGPNQGPGTHFTVSGLCVFEDRENPGVLVPGTQVIVFLTGIEAEGTPRSRDELEDIRQQVTVEDIDEQDFSWSTNELTVPDQAQREDKFFVYAECIGETNFFKSGSFGVGVPETSTSSTTTTTTAPPPASGGGGGGAPTAPATPATPAAPATPATPVAAQPTFTG